MITADKISLIALFVSALVGVYSFVFTQANLKLSRNAFNRSYRPYLFANTMSFNVNGIQTPHMNIIGVIIINAPALVISQNVSFFLREEDKDELLYNHPFEKQTLIYPISDYKYTIATITSAINHNIAINHLPKRLIRKIYIEYRWVSEEKETYYFKSEHEYNVNSKEWENLNQTAN